MSRLLLHLFASMFSLAATGADISGKIFHVDVENRSFELLKETEYDPKSDLGQSRLTVHWTEQTTIRKIEEKTSFAGIEGAVIAEFRGIDAANAAALAERKPFVARVATLFGGVTSVPKENITKNQVTAWFTPDNGDTRSGHFDLEGRQVAVSLRDRNWQIIHHQPIQPPALASGFWQATLTGNDQGGRFVIKHMDVTPLPDPRTTDDPNLPRVLVIGDSISMNYHEAAKSALAGIANFHRNDGNCFSTEHGVRNMELWLGNYREKGFHWDVIQFNHGLHDLKQSYDAATDKWGGYAIPLADYQANLEKEISILRKTGAKLVWCSTTPVPNDNKSTYARRKGASAEFNSAALEVIRRHPDILINDLHAVVDGSPVFDHWRKQNDVHFYQQEEQNLLGRAVAVAVRRALANKPESNIPMPLSIKQGSARTEIIDCHVHLWSLARPAGISWIKKDDSTLFRDYLPADFEAVAKTNGVSGVVLVQAGQSLPDNQWNLDVTAHNPRLFRGLVGNLSEVIGSGRFQPLFTELCKNPRYLGYRLSGRYQDDLSDAFYQDLELTAGKGKSVDVLVGGYSLKDVDAIARRVPKLRIILDHFGNIRLDGNALDPAWVEDFRAVARHPSVYCKVSALYGRVEKQPAPRDIGFYRPILDLAFECFGEDRLVFGSDWPVTGTTGDYASVLALTRAYFDAKGPGVCEKLFHRNAVRFYDIPAAD